jgi:His-Xaa-Ser system radical SAM maturase HxsC
MGVITTRLPVWQRGHHLIFLAKSNNDLRKLSRRPWMQSQLVACIVADHLSLGSNNKLPHVLRLPQNRLENLDNGDVVLLNSFDLTTLYKVGSPHNSILATNRCNCRCVMCPQPPADDPENLLEYNLKLISLMDSKNTEYLGITGGEPTLLGADLIRLVRVCREKLPQTQLTLLTNGRKLKDLDLARDLVKAGFPNLIMEIPLFADNDTEHDAIMGVKGSFYETIEGLYNLARLGQPVGLRTVLHSLTINRLTQYAEYIYRNLPFVVQVAFMGMETIGFARDNLDRLWVDPYEYKEQLLSAVKHLARRMVGVSIYNHQLCILPSDLWPYARKSITTWKQTYLPICKECLVIDQCGGFFGTGIKHSDYIHPLRN